MATRISLRLSFCILGLTLAGMPTAQAQLTQTETAQQLQLNTITTAVPFLMIAPDSRSGALGDAGVALTPDGAAMAWNPARMAFTDQTFEAHMGYAPWLRALVDDMSLAYLSGTRKLNKRQAVGMALRYFSWATSRSPTSTARRSAISVPMSSPSTGFSQKFGDKFSGGFTARYIHSNLTGGTNILGADSRRAAPWRWMWGCSTPTTMSSSATGMAHELGGLCVQCGRQDELYRDG